MRLVTFRSTEGEAARVGLLDGPHVSALVAPSMLELIADGPEALARTAAEPDEQVPLEEVLLLPPVPNPAKIIAIGLNYRDHAAETGREPPEVPLVFAKYPNTLSGAGEPIRIPPITEKADYEAELGVVIGRPAKNVSRAQALDYVFGYMNFHDVSARDLQFGEGGQWTRSKSIDTFGPCGPCIVTTDEVPDPQALGIRSILNGETMQDSNTADMIFPVAELIEFLSTGMTLMPGDIIATGTPAGVGTAFDPPRFLKPGDTVTIEVEGLGTLTNPVEAA